MELLDGPHPIFKADPIHPKEETQLVPTKITILTQWEDLCWGQYLGVSLHKGVSEEGHQMESDLKTPIWIVES